MRKIRKVLRLKFEQNLSNRAIAVSCRVGVATVHEYLARANTAGVSWPLVASVSDEDLEKSLFPPVPTTLSARQERAPDITIVIIWMNFSLDTL